MDDDIEFSFEDYVEAKLEIKRTRKEKKEINKIRDKTITYIRYILFQSNKKNEKKDYSDILNLIPESEKELLLIYFNENKKEFTSYEYRKIIRAIYTFAFLHPEIGMNEELFDIALKRSGSGWKKYKEKVIICYK